MPSHEGYMLSVVPILVFVAIPLLLWTVWITRRIVKESRRKAHYQKRVERQRKHKNMTIHSENRNKVFSIDSKKGDLGMFEFGHVEEPQTIRTPSEHSCDSQNNSTSGSLSGAGSGSDAPDNSTSSLCRICELHETCNSTSNVAKGQFTTIIHIPEQSND